MTDRDSELVRTRRQLRLALVSNARLREEIAEMRPRYQRMLAVHRAEKSKQKQRAELWKHRALNREESSS